MNSNLEPNEEYLWSGTGKYVKIRVLFRTKKVLIEKYINEIDIPL